MHSSNLAKIQKSHPLLPLEPYYQNDAWEIAQCPKYQGGEVNLPKMRNLDFTKLQNINIREECKFYLQHIVENKGVSPSTLCNRYADILSSAEVLNRPTYRTLDSLISTDIEKLILEIKSWRLANGYTNIAEQHRVDKDMGTKEYVYESQPIMMMREFYEYLLTYYNPDLTPEREKDIWDVRNLDFRVEVSSFRPRYTLNFTDIKQQDFRELVKDYSYHRLHTKTLTTALADLRAYKKFSAFLSGAYPDRSIKSLNRTCIEEFYAYLRQNNTSTHKLSLFAGCLKYLFDYAQLSGHQYAPSTQLILTTDLRRKDKALPRFFSEDEIQRLNEHINELPLQIARMLFVIENVGLRVSDLCSLGCDCLISTNDNQYTLRYLQPKTHKWNTIPISEVVAHTLKSAIQESQSEFGTDCKYAFAKSKELPISTDMFSYHLNQLSFKHNLLDDDGMPLRIKAHTFRGTVATNLANLNIDLNIVRLMLGQSSLGVLKHYVTIHDTSMLEAIKPILDEDNQLIANIGNPQNIIVPTPMPESTTPLPNGQCAKPTNAGKCPHANACYECRMFRPSAAHLNVYKRQLEAVKMNIQIAELNGFERILEMNLRTKASLEKIIKSIEGEK